MATKCGRFIKPHVDVNYTPAALRSYVETSLKNSGLETLDLIQLHCPPPASYSRPEIFGLFDDLKKEGKILNLGVSVETVDQALKAPHSIKVKRSLVWTMRRGCRQWTD